MNGAEVIFFASCLFYAVHAIIQVLIHATIMMETGLEKLKKKTAMKSVSGQMAVT